MRAQLNRFLLVFMMLVLPVQTFASAMLGCAMSYQSVSYHSVSYQSAPHQDMAHQGHPSPAQADRPGMAGEPMATCHEPKQTEPAPSLDTCTHCAACYLTSALPPSNVELARGVAASCHFIPHAEVSFIGYIPDSPERPPRIPFV